MKKSREKNKIYYIERHKLWTQDGSNDSLDVAICEYRTRYEPEIIMYDTDLVEEMRCVSKNKEILEHNQNLIIPTPFLKGDIIFYDSIEGREIGVLETDCSCYKYGEDLPRVVSVNRAGYLSSEIFYPYTAELAYSYYDIDVWIKLKNISAILKGNDNLRISNIFEKMY